MDDNPKEKGLYRQIEAEIIDSGSSLASTLRRVKVLASLVGVVELTEWVDRELNGYPDGTALPGYRQFHCGSHGTFSGRFQSVSRNVPIPTALLPDDLAEKVGWIRMGEGIQELQTLASKADSCLERQWNAEWAILAREHLPMDDQSILVEATSRFSVSKVEGVLDAVRNRTLDFLLKLRDLKPEIAESEEAFREIPVEDARQAFEVTIHGDHNMIVAGSGNTQTAQIVKLGDRDSLLRQLRELGIEGTDLSALEGALDADGEPSTEGSFGTKVAEWIGSMTSKAATGAWKVASGATAGVIVELLKQYYGWT